MAARFDKLVRRYLPDLGLTWSNSNTQILCAARETWKGHLDGPARCPSASGSAVRADVAATEPWLDVKFKIPNLSYQKKIYMYEIINLDKIKNELHNLLVNCETSLIRIWLDTKLLQ